MRFLCDAFYLVCNPVFRNDFPSLLSDVLRFFANRSHIICLIPGELNTLTPMFWCLILGRLVPTDAFNLLRRFYNFWYRRGLLLCSLLIICKQIREPGKVGPGFGICRIRRVWFPFLLYLDSRRLRKRMRGLYLLSHLMHNCLVYNWKSHLRLCLERGRCWNLLPCVLPILLRILLSSTVQKGLHLQRIRWHRC